MTATGRRRAHREPGAELLDDARPADLRVVMAPYAVQTAYDSEVQPDVLVARFADLRSKHLRVAPLLALEIL